MSFKPEGCTPDQARNLLFESWEPTPAIETIPVQEANGRVLAHDEYSKINLPHTRSSCLDAVAVRSADFSNGIPDTSNWKLGVDYARADTGDDFDDAFDAVIAIENVDLSKGYPVFDIDEMPEPGDRINPQGATLEKGELLVSGHTVLHPNSVATLAMGGHSEIEVLKRPRIGFIPTGSELIAIGDVQERGQAFDCNSMMAKMLLGEYGAEAAAYPIVKDDREALAKSLDDALETQDIIILNGGSSKGSEDFNRPLIEERGGNLLDHWMLCAPGRPLCAGIVKGKVVLVIPGPPVGALNVLEYLVSTIVDRWYDIKTRRQTVRAILTEDVVGPEHMQIFVAANISRSWDGALYATPLFFRQNMASAMSADGYLYSPLGSSFIPAGTEVEVSVFGSRLQLFS